LVVGPSQIVTLKPFDECSTPLEVGRKGKVLQDMLGLAQPRFANSKPEPRCESLEGSRRPEVRVSESSVLGTVRLEERTPLWRVWRIEATDDSGGVKEECNRDSQVYFGEYS